MAPSDNAQAQAAGGKGKAAKWQPLPREYAVEFQRLSLRASFRRSREHPLQPSWTKKKPAPKKAAAAAAAAATAAAAAGDADQARQQAQEQAEESKVPVGVADDPLSMLAAAQPLPLGVADDPLSSMMGAPSPAAPVPHAAPSPAAAKTPAAAAAKSQRGLPDDPSRDFEPWAAKKARVLAKYTTNKRIAVTANFLDEQTSAAEELNKPVAVDDRMTSRLEQLETDPESEVAKQYLTQKEYIAHIEEQHDNLKQAWDAGERVMSLKIAIQCAKLLGDTRVPAFFPSMYVLLSAILDTFGDLVFERIRRKGRGGAGALPEDFVAEDVSADARETCRNWFYKTACIRELVPRLYIEMALIRCNRFLADGQFPAILERQARAIRGIGDPLTAAYASAYLATKSREVAPYCARPLSTVQPLMIAFHDFMFAFSARKRAKWATVPPVAGNKVSADHYVDLFAPALEWLLQCVGHNSTEDVFFALLQQFQHYCNNDAVLVHLLASFSPRFISKHAMSMTQLIKGSEPSTCLPKSRLYLTLGRSLIASSPPKEQRLAILNDVWKVVTKISDPAEYSEIAEVFVEFLLRHFSVREVNIFLKDLIKHVKPDGAYKELQERLGAVVHKVLAHSESLDQTLGMDSFLPLLDLLQGAAKVTASKAVLGALARSSVTVSDPVTLHTLFDVARSLHDSVDSLSFDDERRQIAELVIGFVRKIDFGRDLEKQLSTYVECRAAFTNLDSVTRELVLRVALLATRAHRFMRGRHNRKTSAFVKACLAYCHITIASLDDIFARLLLFLNCGQVALVNGMIVQGEGFLKAAVSLIPEVPAQREVRGKMHGTEADVQHFVATFSSFLLLFPGHPQHGPFYLVKGLLAALQQYEPWAGAKATPRKTAVYIGVLQLFCTYCQRNFPYHIDGVESNDRLFGGDADYMGTLNVYIEQLVDEILAQLTEIGKPGDLTARKEQGTLALDVVNVLVASFVMNPTSATLVVKLYQLAEKSSAVSAAYLRNTLDNIRARKGSWYADVADKIAGQQEQQQQQQQQQQ